MNFAQAIEAHLQMYRRRRIDTAFAGMAKDTDYQREATSIAEEFEHSDWDALGWEKSP